jgi:hypothetical protein
MQNLKRPELRVAAHRAGTDFNILGNPDLRACYDALLANHEAPASFSYGGLVRFWFPENLAATDTHSSLAASCFLTRLHTRRLHAPLRRCDFYDDRALCGDARLFRDEYILDVEKAVVVETPQLGHATYVFAQPRRMDNFLALYAKLTKLDIRQIRNNSLSGLDSWGVLFTVTIQERRSRKSGSA